MVKLFRIPGTDVKIRIKQDEGFWVKIEFDSNESSILNPSIHDEDIRALGFQPRPIDGGDLEEVTE